MHWYDDGLNAVHMSALARMTREERRLLIFLGAGLSFGAARLKGRAVFDDNDGRHDMGRAKRAAPPPPATPDSRAWDDDGKPLPSWTWLISRMHQQLAIRCASGTEKADLDAFFASEGPLDCAELFRKSVGDINYREFLQEQFDARRHDLYPTPSHFALVALDLPLLFTTNFDELLETAHVRAALELTVSSDEAEFQGNRAASPERHLVKLHGTISRGQTIVLTRSDYAHACRVRREMFGHLRSELARSAFLFVGFSLTDPNFNVLLDDVHDALGGNAPANYTVQAGRNAVKARYLEALGVNTVWLDDWNNLPDFLYRLGPDA